MTYITGCDSGANLDFATNLDSTITFTRYPELQLYTQRAPLPPIEAIYPDIQGQRLKFPHPASSVQWQTLNVTFLVLKDLSNYVAIHDWIVESINQKREDIISDASQLFTTGDKRVVREAHYINMFPVALSGLNQNVDSAQIEYQTATVTFRYYYYEFK